MRKKEEHHLLHGFRAVVVVAWLAAEKNREGTEQRPRKGKTGERGIELQWRVES